MVSMLSLCQRGFQRLGICEVMYFGSLPVIGRPALSPGVLVGWRTEEGAESRGEIEGERWQRGLPEF